MRYAPLALLAVLLTACQPASASGPTPSPGPPSGPRGFVVERGKSTHVLVVLDDTSTTKTALYDTPAWRACKQGEHYPECLKGG